MLSLRTLACFLWAAAVATGALAEEADAQEARAQEVDAQEAKADLSDLLRRGTEQAQRREYEPAIEQFTAAIKLAPENSTAWYLRGRANFCAGKIAESVADFDQHVKLSPDAESRQWERGIAYYYAGEFAKGAKQFELYQTYHDQDVENSVWRYLCVAKEQGVEAAVKNMLPIERDPRIPMMTIYDLYRGKAKPEAVLTAARAGEPLAAELNSRLFYAHLYLGLWYEAAGKAEEAREHLLAAEKHKISHYMWDVAHVHAEKLRKGEK
jgi:lipoprotein NlpI